MISLLGKGGMGEVYRATDLTLAQPVALKFLPDTGGDFQRSLERFHNEVRVARQVSHPNVCRVYDVGEAEGMPYISMEYVDGEDLEALLHRIGRLPSERAVEIARKICAGVAAAHDKGVIHRDLKPANVMLDRRGHVVIMDFGLAAAASELRGPEARSGTPAYMAPEQLRGEEVTARSDIYALGLVLYQMFTGKRAYEAKSLEDLIRLQDRAELSSMSSVAADIDPSVEKIIRRCLDPVPARRPQTALSVAMSLPGGDPLAAALAAGETPSPEMVAASGATGSLPLKKALPLAAGVMALLALVPVIRHYAELHSVTPMDIPPPALAQKAREIAASFGYTARPADSHYQMEWITRLLTEARQHSGGGRENLRARLAVEPPMQLGYRESPVPLIAAHDVELNYERPAPIVSGMIEARLNSNGQLRRFLAVPDQQDSAPPTADIDVQPLARATGFDLAHWEPAMPKFAPLYATDWQKAWKTHHPQLDVDVLVQASAWHGRITEVQTLWPWTVPGRMPENRSTSLRDWVFGLGTGTSYLILMVFSALLAARNLRTGRGDQRSATRLALLIFVLAAAAWMCRVHWVPDTAMGSAVSSVGASWVATAVFAWAVYIALEPAVRARWPHALVTWTRLITGNWRDPQVGAHILYGMAAGIGVSYMFLAMGFGASLRGDVAQFADANAGLTALRWLSDILTIGVEATLGGLAMIFALFGLRLLGRSDWVAAGIAALLLTALEGEVWREGGWFIVALYSLVFAVLMLMLLRMGLLGSVVAVMTANLMLRVPGPQDLTRWYEWSAIATPALFCAVALWAFWRASGREAFSAPAS